MKANHLNFISKGTSFLLALIGGIMVLLGKDVEVGQLLSVCGFLMAIFVSVDVSMVRKSLEKTDEE